MKHSLRMGFAVIVMAVSFVANSAHAQDDYYRRERRHNNNGALMGGLLGLGLGIIVGSEMNGGNGPDIHVDLGDNRRPSRRSYDNDDGGFYESYGQGQVREGLVCRRFTRVQVDQYGRVVDQQAGEVTCRERRGHTFRPIAREDIIRQDDQKLEPQYQEQVIRPYRDNNSAPAIVGGRQVRPYLNNGVAGQNQAPAVLPLNRQNLQLQGSQEAPAVLPLASGAVQ